MTSQRSSVKTRSAAGRRSHPDAELAALPVAQHDLAQLADDMRVEPGPGDEGRSGLDPPLAPAVRGSGAAGRRAPSPPSLRTLSKREADRDRQPRPSVARTGLDAHVVGELREVMLGELAGAASSASGWLPATRWHCAF